MEDPPTGGAIPGNGAISRPVDKPNQALSSTPDSGVPDKEQSGHPRSCHCSIKLKKKKKKKDTAFLGHGTSARAIALNLQGVQSPFRTDQQLEHAIIPQVRHNPSRPSSQQHPILVGTGLTIGPASLPRSSRMTHTDQAVTWEDRRARSQPLFSSGSAGEPHCNPEDPSNPRNRPL